MSDNRELAEVIYDLAKVAAREEFGQYVNTLQSAVLNLQTSVLGLQEEITELRDEVQRPVPEPQSLRS
jgi:hypothetical protein